MLERRGTVSGFWIGRAFRLYPLWAVVVAVAAGGVLRCLGARTPRW
ncbi:hypothetical protein LDL08_33600 [Nonomuraea glycinis]|uniref:Uncharacterized protein n=1 Tax=Nonomuraea glycinis TaxID=2047744 RepID=A0A918AB44_9ACTN|nr:hypothetical protein [Nonomuraea glycinis]MCA2181123.1 hypothetical protein [Nonomuraea glycinis]GGP13613.1 hypothetical protein GCM10012278_66090 [Nonomuraea glycinis]